MRAYDKFWDRVSTQKILEYSWKVKMEEAEAKASEAEARVIESALKMIADGMPENLIAKYTGLTVEEIEAL